MISRITISLRKNVRSGEDDWIQNDPTLSLKPANREVSTWAFGMGGRRASREAPNPLEVDNDLDDSDIEDLDSIAELEGIRTTADIPLRKLDFQNSRAPS